VLDSLRTGLRGDTAAGFASGGRRVDVRVRLNPAETADTSRLVKVRVPVENGLIETGTLGRFERTRSYGQLHRYNRRPAVSLTVYPVQGAKGRVLDVLSAGRDEGARQQTGAESAGRVLSVSALKDSQRHILMVFGFALLLMYLLIGAQFESFLIPIALLLSLLPALSGSLIVLFLSGYSLNVNSFLGILILLGTAINISIILTAGIVGQRSIPGRSVVEVSEARLKPITATVMSTVAAMVPIAVYTAGEAALQSNTAVALIGGLMIGMVSILLIFPIFYERLIGGSRTR
jgi:multidrug efflux pump subunit AcrB